jgi:hypothetical protein
MQTDAALLNDILVASADAIITGEGQCIMVFNTSAQTMLGYSAAMNGGKD